MIFFMTSSKGNIVLWANCLKYTYDISRLLIEFYIAVGNDSTHK